jgi:hypothetical protein
MFDTETSNYNIDKDHRHIEAHNWNVFTFFYNLKAYIFRNKLEIPKEAPSLLSDYNLFFK